MKQRFLYAIELNFKCKPNKVRAYDSLAYNILLNYHQIFYLEYLHKTHFSAQPYSAIISPILASLRNFHVSSSPSWPNTSAERKNGT